MAIGSYRYLDRGPTSSSDYNNRVRDTVDAFLELNGRLSIAEGELDSITALTTVEQLALTGVFDSLRSELEIAQASAGFTQPGTKIVGLYADTVHRTAGGEPAIANNSTTTIVTPLAWESDSGLVTLPQSQMNSKLNYTTGSGVQVDPDVLVAWTHTDAAGNLSYNDKMRAVDGKDSTAFLVRTNSVSGRKTLTYYMSVPPETAEGATVNYLEIIPAPIVDCTLERVQYSTDVGAQLNETTTWNDFYYYDDTSAGHGADIRFKPPQMNGTNIQQNCGLRRYYFGERTITAVKVVLTTDKTVDIGNGNEKILGIRRLDVGHISWGPNGKLVFDVHLPVAVRKVTDVRPRIINRGLSTDLVDGIGVDDASIVLYRNAGTWQTYTKNTDVGAGNEFQDFRIEVELNLASNGNTPQLAGFEVDYSVT